MTYSFKITKEVKRNIYFISIVIFGLFIAYFMLKYGGTAEEIQMTNALIN